MIWNVYCRPIIVFLVLCVLCFTLCL